MYTLKSNAYSIYLLCSAKSVDVDGTSIYFRGFKILQTILQSVMDKGMSNAKEVILTGCSGDNYQLLF